MNRLNLGMTKQEVVSVLGEPNSTAAPGGGIEILRYNLTSPADDPLHIHHISNEYFVKLVNDKVQSYGKMGDFDSTKDPTLDLNIKNQ